MIKQSYIPLKGENFFCVPVSLYIIIKSEGFSLSLEDIISDFKYYFPINYIIPYKINNYKYTSVKKKWGIVTEEETINLFFKKRNLPFVELFISINTIAEYNFHDFLYTAKSNGNHIIFGYDYSRLYNGIKGDVGHVSIVNSIISEDIIEIIDPGEKDYGIKQISLYNVYYSIKSRNDGLWIIQRKN